MQEHESYMKRCLELARMGMGHVSPNPLVGALLVHQGRIVAEGFHQQYGGAHAEANAIRQLQARLGQQEAAQILRQSTLYVNLEPCSHQGKTPPCADLILHHEIPRVVVGMSDPSAKVNGAGIQRLRDRGTEVLVGILEQEAQWLNRRFSTQSGKNRPYIILKWAQTADGFMAPLKQEKRWITGPEARQLVHQWRSEEDAVLVGCGTALADNPRLNVRDWKGRSPRRVLIDRDLQVSKTAALFDRQGAEDGETIVFNAHKSEWRDGVRWVALENFDLYLPQQIAYQLYLLDVQSLIVEGGINTLRQFIDAGMWDEARILESKVTWEEGRPAPTIVGRQHGNPLMLSANDSLRIVLHETGTLFAVNPLT